MVDVSTEIVNDIADVQSKDIIATLNPYEKNIDRKFNW